MRRDRSDSWNYILYSDGDTPSLFMTCIMPYLDYNDEWKVKQAKASLGRYKGMIHISEKHVIEYHMRPSSSIGDRIWRFVDRSEPNEWFKFRMMNHLYCPFSLFFPEEFGREPNSIYRCRRIASWYRHYKLDLDMMRRDGSMLADRIVNLCLKYLDTE